ncbi:MAG: 3-oxoacyl-ACP reductase FabG [Victivallales bacterium]|nr:3-oxoacyl-ACP reductase FabG [Victivallales bacterium]
MSNLTDRVAIVTGGSRGIGLAIAKRLCKDGATVAVVSTTQDGVDRAAEEIRAAGGQCRGWACDVADNAAVTTLVQEALNAYGRLDILVNCAGITRDNLLVRMAEEDWDRVMAVNLKSAYNTVKAALRPMMKARYGRIISVSSVVALAGNAGQANYAATKAGLIGFSKSIAREVGSRGITVNVVAPGFIETDMTATLSQQARDAFLNAVPLARAGQPADVAAAVAFLAGPDAEYITGQVLCVDGGFRMP